MRVRFFDPGKSYLKIKEEIDNAIKIVLTNGDLILRQDVEKFEDNLAKFIGTKYAVALSSGTDALVCSLKALGVKKGWKVGVPALTFKATVGAILTVGARPIIADIGEPFKKCDVAIPVHIAGEIDKRETRGVPVIEDAAQALGASRNGKMAGSMGKIGCFSFYPAKILGAYGDAGAITTDSRKIYKEIKEMRNHYKGTNKDFGGNFRMDNLQAAILNIKFKYLPYYLMRRKEIAEEYSRQLSELFPFCTLPTYPSGKVWQDYVLETDCRDELFQFLKEEGIETMKNEYPFSIKYPKPPRSALFESQTLRLPCNPDLTNEEVDYVILKIKEFYGKNMQ